MTTPISKPSEYFAPAQKDLYKLRGTTWAWPDQKKTITFADSEGGVPWVSGRDGRAWRLLDRKGKVAYYIKFATVYDEQDVALCNYMLDRKLWTWSASFKGAPLNWYCSDFDSERAGAYDFGFAGFLMSPCTSSMSFKELKEQICAGELELSFHQRWRLFTELIQALAILESRRLHFKEREQKPPVHMKLAHGDLSPANLFIDLEAELAPMLQLIDFSALSVWEDGKILFRGKPGGTQGYTQPNQPFDMAKEEFTVDRYARDLLLIEFLTVEKGLNPRETAREWYEQAPAHFERVVNAALARCPLPELAQQWINYFQPEEIVRYTPIRRHSSTKLATLLHLEEYQEQFQWKLLQG